jgi:hypothetical protein
VGPARVTGTAFVFKRSGSSVVTYVPAHAVLEFSYDSTEEVLTISTALATYVFNGIKEFPLDTYKLLTGGKPEKK